MRVYTLWHEGDAGEVPWIIDAVDLCTINNNEGFPPPYLEHRANIHVRELIIDVPGNAVGALFSVPIVSATAIENDQKVEVRLKALEESDTLLLTAREFGRGNARAGDVAAAAYRLAAAKLRAWGAARHAKDLEGAASQAEAGPETPRDIT